MYRNAQDPYRPPSTIPTSYPIDWSYNYSLSTVHISSQLPYHSSYSYYSCSRCCYNCSYHCGISRYSSKYPYCRDPPDYYNIAYFHGPSYQLPSYEGDWVTLIYRKSVKQGCARRGVMGWCWDVCSCWVINVIALVGLVAVCWRWWL